MKAATALLGCQKKYRASHLSRKRAHIFSYETFVGPVPKNKFVLHTCDIRCCVNPKHLYIGTKKQNTQDCIKRDRFQMGTRHAHTSLNEDQVRAIRKDQRVQRVIATEYGVCQMTISNIKRRFTWKYLP
jgi:HNH endonuclease